MEYTLTRSDEYLEHHGIKGQKWGVRNYQNEDGSLTEEGKRRYTQQGWEARQMYKRGEISKQEKKQAMKAGNILGKLDNVANLGFGRRYREFVDRHKKGYIAAEAVLGAAGTIAVGALTGGNFAAMARMGKLAVASTLGTAFGVHVVNRAMLDYGYNRKLNGDKSYERREKQEEQSRG